jgi:amidase
MDLWWRLAWTEINQALGPTIRKHGGDKFNDAIGRYISATPDLDLPAFIRETARRATLLREWLLFLDRYPLVVGPVSTELPFAVDFDTDPSGTAERLKAAFRLLCAVNLLGLPAIAVPTGTSGGLPVGVQVIGSRYREDLCFDAAEAIEAQCGLGTPIDPAWESQTADTGRL